VKRGKDAKSIQKTSTTKIPKNTCPLAIAAVKMSQLFQGEKNFQNRISKSFNDDRGLARVIRRDYFKILFVTLPQTKPWIEVQVYL